MDLSKDLERQSTMNTTWHSCCLTIDRNAAKHFIQVSILSGLIVVSLTMLMYDKDWNSQKWWSGLLTLCLGVFLPSPRLS